MKNKYSKGKISLQERRKRLFLVILGIKIGIKLFKYIKMELSYGYA